MVTVVQEGGRVRPSPFRVLLVSARSTCRAPAAQWLLRAHLRAAGHGADVLLGSAGSEAEPAESMHPETVRALAELEVTVVDHVVRRLTQRRAAQADLVLTADAAVAAAVVRLWPDAAPRTFTLAEFARLAGNGGAPESPAALVAGLDRVRSVRPGAQEPDTDLPDPAGGGYADHRRTVRELDALARTIAGAISAARRAETIPLQPV